MPFDNQTPLSPEEMFEKRAQAAQFKEASEYPTIATGDYKVTGDSGEAFLDKDPRVLVAYPTGRVILKLKGTAYIGEDRKGKVSCTISPDMAQGVGVRPDQKFRQWCQLVKVLFPDVAAADQSQVNVSQVIERWTKYPVGMYITQTFSEPIPGDPDGKKRWFDARTPEEVAEHRAAARSANNFVKNIYAYKG